MVGPHDIGGQNLGPINFSPESKSLLDKRIDVLQRLVGAAGARVYRVDELRFMIEGLSPEMYRKLKESSEILRNTGDKYDEKYGDNNKNIQDIDNDLEKYNNLYYNLKDQKSNLLIKESENSNMSSTHYSYLTNIEGLTLDEINSYEEINEKEDELINNIKTCEDTIESIGVVNYLAKEDYEALNTRYTEIQESIDDLLLTKKELLTDLKVMKFSVPARAARLLKVRRTIRFCRFGTS